MRHAVLDQKKKSKTIFRNVIFPYFEQFRPPVVFATVYQRFSLLCTLSINLASSKGTFAHPHPLTF